MLPRHRKVIFVNGCFWHRHDCPDGRKLPRSKPEYWGPKLERNRARDPRQIAELRELGWDVLVVWECEIFWAIRLQDRIATWLAIPSTEAPTSQPRTLEPSPRRLHLRANEECDR